MKKYKIINPIALLILIIIVNKSIFAQKPSLSIITSKTDETGNIYANIKPNDLVNLCAVGIKISYDTTKLKFVECNSVNSKIKSSIFNASHGIFAFAWTSADGRTPVEIGKDNMFTIVFKRKIKGSSELKFLKDETMTSDCNLKVPTLILNDLKISDH